MTNALLALYSDKRRFALEFVKSRSEEGDDTVVVEVHLKNRTPPSFNQEFPVAASRGPRVNAIRIGHETARSPGVFHGTRNQGLSANAQNGHAFRGSPDVETMASMMSLPPRPAYGHSQEDLARLLQDPQVSHMLTGAILKSQAPSQQNLSGPNLADLEVDDLGPVDYLGPIVPEAVFDNDSVSYLEDIFQITHL